MKQGRLVGLRGKINEVVYELNRACASCLAELDEFVHMGLLMYRTLSGESI